MQSVKHTDTNRNKPNTTATLNHKIVSIRCEQFQFFIFQSLSNPWKCLEKYYSKNEASDSGKEGIEERESVKIKCIHLQKAERASIMCNVFECWRHMLVLPRACILRKVFLKYLIQRRPSHRKQPTEINMYVVQWIRLEFEYITHSGRRY